MGSLVSEFRFRSFQISHESSFWCNLGQVILLLWYWVVTHGKLLQLLPYNAKKSCVWVTRPTLFLVLTIFFRLNFFKLTMLWLSTLVRYSSPSVRGLAYQCHCQMEGGCCSVLEQFGYIYEHVLVMMDDDLIETWNIWANYVAGSLEFKKQFRSILLGSACHPKQSVFGPGLICSVQRGIFHPCTPVFWSEATIGRSVMLISLWVHQLAPQTVPSRRMQTCAPALHMLRIILFWKAANIIDQKLIIGVAKMCSLLVSVTQVYRCRYCWVLCLYTWGHRDFKTSLISVAVLGNSYFSTAQANACLWNVTMTI